MLTPHAFHRAMADCRRAFFWAAGFSFAANLLLLTVPLYMLQVYDRVLNSRSVATLVYLTVIALTALIALGLFEMARSRLLVRIGTFIDARVAPIAFERMLANNIAGTPRRWDAVRDLREVRMFLTGTGILALFDLPWAPIFLAAIFLLHPLLGAFSLASLVVLIVLTLANDRLAGPQLRRSSEISFAAARELEIFNRNAETIDALGMMRVVGRRWLRKNNEAIRLQADASDVGGVIVSVSKGFRLSVQVLILGIGAWLVLQGEATGGTMVAGSILLARALGPIDLALASWRGMVSARSAYNRLDECLSAPHVRPAGMKLPAPKGQLAFEGVSFTAPSNGRIILSDISFELPAGETLAVVGPSAAGKSTLARLAVGISAPSGGHVRLDGADLFPWNREQLGRHIGYVSQDVTLFSGTVAENIARLEDSDPDAIIEAAQRAGVHEMILRLPQGYDTDIGDFGMRLSGGQRQRVALARAIYGSPTFVVLDEPNANLDSEGDGALVRALAELRELGTTVIFITHRPGLIGCADKLLLLRDGTAEMFGPRQEIVEFLKPNTIAPAAMRRFARPIDRHRGGGA